MTKNDSTTLPWLIEYFESDVDKVKIRFAYLKPRQNKPKHAILLLNGRSEWIEKYLNLPLQLGWIDDAIWVTLDHRGQGQSDGKRSFVNSYEEFARDAAKALKIAAGTLPYAIISHSMGGLVALFGTLTGHLNPKALGLCSPLLALPNKPLSRKIAKPLAQLLVHSGLGHQHSGAGSAKRQTFDRNPLTSSIEGFELTANSPFPYSSPTFGWINATFNACQFVFDETKLMSLRVPTRILGGSLETIVDSSGWSSWCLIASKNSDTPVEFFRIQNGRHELLNEVTIVKEQCLELLRNFLVKYLLNS